MDASCGLLGPYSLAISNSRNSVFRIPYSPSHPLTISTLFLRAGESLIRLPTDAGACRPRKSPASQRCLAHPHRPSRRSSTSFSDSVPHAPCPSQIPTLRLWGDGRRGWCTFSACIGPATAAARFSSTTGFARVVSRNNRNNAPTADGRYETQSSAFFALGTHSVHSALCRN